MSTGVPPASSLQRKRSEAQHRTLDAALELFAQHGVSGTSFQMIADAVGVTKAAVYHQFKVKEDLVIAVTERELAGLEPTLDAAEAEPDSDRARDILLDRVIDLAIRNRGLVGTLQFDPVIVRLLAEHKPFLDFLTRLFAVMAGDNTTDTRVPTVMLSGSIAVAVMHPLLADMAPETLRTEITKTARRILNATGPH
ncbi:TetR/AcrR family transcriptional regulator [Nocardia vinacea]|uniref:TetR/AcrR family transcriptional regulator n=1 Tax=Nocardia vinacea TaxID=96468 RepID=UPI0033DDBE02